MYECKCCCAEHTFADCPARKDYTCRGAYEPDHLQEERSWLRFYMEERGWTEDEFYCAT